MFSMRWFSSLSSLRPDQKYELLMCIFEISTIILIFAKTESIGSVQLKINSPSPNSEFRERGGSNVTIVWVGGGLSN